MDDLENEKSDEKTDSCRVKRMRGWLGVKSDFFGDYGEGHSGWNR